MRRLRSLGPDRPAVKNPNDQKLLGVQSIAKMPVVYRWMDCGVADPEDPALQCASDARLGVLLAPPEEIGSVLDDLEERCGTVANWLEREAGFGAGCAAHTSSNTLTPAQC